MIDTKIQLNLEIDKDELYWEQQARVNWLRASDKNSSFFHNFALVKKRRNKIKKLKDGLGRIISDEIEMERIT